MQIFLNVLNAKKISVEINPMDKVEILKKKITEATGLGIHEQSLRLPNGKNILNGTQLCLGDLFKAGTLINLTYQQEKRASSFYLNAVTGSGRVFTVNPEKGSATTVEILRTQIASKLDLPAECLFLREVDMSRFLNKSLVPLFSTLKEFSVVRGSVLYLQIHPWKESWYHGKISRDQAEQLMLSATSGQFLVKESVNFPGDYVLFVSIDGTTKHYRIFCKKNMMFTINDREYFNSIEEMVKVYQGIRGRLPIKLTEPVNCSQISLSEDGASLYSWEASLSDGPPPRDRLQTAASAEIHLRVVLGAETLSLLTSPFNKVRTLKEQIEELRGVPVDCQLLRLDDKPLLMDTFLVCDHHITDDSVVYVQVHPWNEDWYVGRMSAVEVESLVSELTEKPDGMFLVRESISYPGDYVLYVWSKGKSRQVRVLNQKKRFTLDSKQLFNSLAQLIEYYKKHEGPLGTRLDKPLKCDKEQRGIIPPAVLARGTKARDAYRRALKKGRTRDVRVRVMLIGQDRAGKTSLKRSLKGESFNKYEASTDGVEMGAPLLKVGIQAWKTPQTDEYTTAFDHRSAQIVARQLSRGSSDELSDSGTELMWSPGPHEQSSSVNGTLPNEVQSARTSPIRGVFDNNKRQSAPVSPSSPGEVFAIDFHREDSLPQGIVSLVEGMLREQPDINDEVWPVIWDFAGQSLYHALHPIFMSREAVYLLICNLNADLLGRAESSEKPSDLTEKTMDSSENEETNLDHLMRWMDLVHSLSDPTDSRPVVVAQPPVILVGTHADKVVGDPWKSIDAILDSFLGKSFASHIVEEQFVVDNTRAGKPFQQEDPNIHRLRQKILSVAAKQLHARREIPLQWLLVEKELKHMAGKLGVKHITRSKFKLIAEEICKFNVEEDSDELLNFLNDCGAVLNLSESNDPEGLIIVDPQWLVEAFCQIITAAPGKKEPMPIRAHRKALATDGILSEELIDYACQNLGLSNATDSLLSILEKSSLICKWDSENGSLAYLVPFMLTAKPQMEIASLTDKGPIAPVYITFNTGYVPHGLFARLLALFGHWAKETFSPRQPKLYANVARFFIGEKNDFCVSFVCYRAVIKIDLLCERESDPKGETKMICGDLVRIVEVSLTSLREKCSWLRSLAWQLCAQCDLCNGEGEDPQGCFWHHVSTCTHPDCGHFVSLDSEPLRCYRTFKSDTFLRMEKLKPWVKNVCCRSDDPGQLQYKPGRISNDDRLLLALDIGKQWETLCCHLLDEREREHIDYDEKTLYDKCFRMLTRWSQAHGSEATYATLGQALMMVDREDLCKKYCLRPSEEVLSSQYKHIS